MMNNHENISARKSITSNRLSTKSLVLAAIFVAMNIILTRLGAIMLFNGSVRFSFGRIPLVLSGLLLGPLAGAMTGGASDLLGFLINSHGGGFHPGFTLSAMITGAIPGIVVLISRTKKTSLFNVVISNLFIFLLVSTLLNTFWLSQLQGSAYLILLWPRVFSNLVITILNIVITYPLAKTLEKTGII